MKNKAFTLVELLIAMGLLSLVIISTFSIFSDSSKSFKSGNWRISRQKAAQIFLLKFKENIEKVSHVNVLKKDGTQSRQSKMNIAIPSDFYNKIASTTNSGIIFASCCTPICESNTELKTEQKNGVWKGFSLECFNKKLAFLQTATVNKMPSSVPANVFPANWANVTRGKTNGDFVITLEDVDSIGVFVQKTTDSTELNRPEILLTLKITMVMPNSRGQTKVSEQITAKIHDRDIDNEIEKDKPSYPISSGRNS